MAELSTYRLEWLQDDAGLVRYRGRKAFGAQQILVSIPQSKQAAPGILKRLECEYALKQELDPAWAVLPLELVHEMGQTALVFQDPGGEPLDRILGRPMELTQFLWIAISITAAIGRLHERGIIHKDIKPANIMVDLKSGQSWLTGFGIASRLSREHQTFGAPDIPATFEYMAPEQTGRMNRPVDSRSDLYSLGVTFYQMLTGVLPFAAVDPLGWAHCHIAKRPLSPGERRKEIPPTLSAIILKLLAKAPEERYQTARGLEADLRRCQMDWESLERIDLFGLGAEDRPDQLVIPRKLYGRVKESKALLEAFNEHVECEAPVLVLISGYSGVGKSSLANALGQSVLLTRGFFVSGKFDLYKRDIPYATVGEAFQALVRQLLSKSEVELNRWREAMGAALGSNGQLIVNLIPDLELIIGQQPPIPELPVQEAQNRFREVMRAFLGVFAQKEHPLVLFLDDLQWLDPATFKLIEDMIAPPGVRHLLLIGAYRDNEVGASHPLTMMVNRIRQTNASVRKIVLSPLSQIDLDLLISDTLQQEPATVEPLARLLHEKTAGNPFFVIQFLTALFEEHLLQFDRNKRAWRWEISRIQARQITDNVVDLMLAKLNRLPATTRETLKQLSCVGNRVKATDLTVVCEKPQQQVQSDLWDAVQAGFIIQLTDSYSFVHDRVQEVTYSLIAKEERAASHLRIGRLLLANAAEEELPEKIFEIVNQLNRGATLILSPDEQKRVAELNLLAGQRAQLSAAHTSALRYLSAGAALLAPAPWKRQYKLAFALEFHRAKSEFVTGDLEAAEQRLTALSSRARTLVDHAAVAGLRLDLYTTLDRSGRAVEICLEYLKLLEIAWSPHPTEEEVFEEYREMWRRLGDRPIEAIVDLPTMTDPDWCATMDVLTKVMPPAMFTDKNLQCLVLGRMANISFEHGICDGSCLGYVWLGGVLGSCFGDYQSGFRFGKVSVEIMEQRELNRFKARVYLGFGSLVNFWTRHSRTGFALMRQAFDAAQEAGDLTYAAYARYDLIGHLLSAGSPLNELQREAETALQLASSARFGLMVDGLTGQLRLIRMLRGLTSIFGSFDDEHFDEVEFERHLEGDPHLANPACRYWIRKLQARFYAGKHAQAMEAAEKAQGLLWAMPPSIEIPDYHFHAALALAQHYPGSPVHLQPQHLETLLAHQNQLAVWARNCPENFGNRAVLIGAEIARIKGQILEAERLYEEAIRSAHENGFVNNEAIAQETAGKFYLDRGFEAIGQTYLRSARSCYQRWGADAKVKQLDRSYPGFEEPALGSMATASAPLRQLDLVAVVNALQAVSREIDLGKLIETLMVISLQHASAERGLLFLVRGQELTVEAEATTDGDHVRVVLQHAVPQCPGFPECVVRYVFRTHTNVIATDALAEHPFSDDEYIRTRRPRSILCLPLIKQGTLIGELYLENNQISGVFDKDRLTVLELLASQAAISLENASLYAELRQENSDRRKAEEALRASEERMSLAAESANLGLWVWEIQDDDIWATEKCRSLYGFGPDERLNLQRFVDCIHPEDRKPTVEALRRSLENRTECEVEYRLVVTDSSIRWISTRGHAIFDSENRAVRVMGVSIDITAAKTAELQLLQQRDELAHLSRVATIGQMATTVAHELNQPIGAIHSNAEAAEILLQEDPPELDQLRAIVSDIRRDGWRAGEVIQRMRSLLRKREFSMEPIDLKGLMEEVGELLHGTVISHQARLRIEAAPALPAILGDPVHLQQVLLNLILNALEAMEDCPPEERRVLVRVSTRTPQGVEVTVTDQGPGFPKWQLSRLFEPFLSTKKNGMGMGLAICQTIVQAHGGHFTASNNPDRGVTLRFTLPRTYSRKEES